MLVEGTGRGTYIRYVGLPLPKLPQILQQAALDALVHCCHVWLKRYAPTHFTMTAYSKYGGREERVYDYRWKSSTQGNRRAKNLRAYFARQGRNMSEPLVWKGNLRRAFMGGMVTKTGGSGVSIFVKATWPALPRYTYYTKYGANRIEGPRKYRELTIMTEREEKDLADVFSKQMQKALDEQSL